MQPSTVNLPVQESFLLYGHIQLLYFGPNFPLNDPEVIEGN